MDDDLLKEFLNESREHLATIETDLLAIEEGGAHIDKELVNKVFRAAHSIKGGSSFFGLTKVKELAHRAETVLDMLRSGKMAPNAECTNVLLAAFDKLRDLLNRPAESAHAEIGDLLEGLNTLASSYLEPEKKASLNRNLELQPSSQGRAIALPEVDIERARRTGQCIYCVDYDLIHDIEKKGLKLLPSFHELSEFGEILECVMDFESVGTLDDPIGKCLPLKLVFSTSIDIQMLSELLSVAIDKIQLLFDPFEKQPASEPPVPVAMPMATEPPPAAATPTTPAPIAARMVEDAKPQPPLPSPPAIAPAGLVESAPPAESPVPAIQGPAAVADETLRVSVSLLETLMNLAGELVLSRNQLRTAVTQNDVQSLSVAGQRLNQVTSELQDAIMRTRLQPIGTVFAKFPRVVRDMANALDKQIQLDIRGKDVALDRSLIEGLSDPLTHMVRNAVDHGIEKAEQRIKAGKKATGTILIEARHEAGQVVVEIADDGKGIDGRRVGDAALAKGLITVEKLKTMSEQEKMMLIFLPGLSTAEKVTDISGRGVGMDVVKTNLERLGGKIEIKSEAGKGSLFRIKLPLTLAIIPSLIVSVGGDRFAIPQVNVEELLRIRPEELKQRIQVVGEAEVLLLRDRIIPLVHLDRLLDTTPAMVHLPAATGGEPQTSALEIAVVTTGTMQYGLAVAAYHDTEEIVVKPLGQHLKALREYAGATILGDGKVALILDVAGVAAKAKLTDLTEAARAAHSAKIAETHGTDATQALVLFQNGPRERCAIPLDTVLRIERIKPEQVETAGRRRTLQYRGASLPLVTLADAANVDAIDEAKDLAVIVSSVNRREVGLLGAMPVDVVETQAAIDRFTHRQKGIAGSAIIRDRTTLITDLFELVDAVYPEWGNPPGEQLPVTTKQSSAAVLLAEDSDFFRGQVKKFLEQEGLTVLDAPDGEAAWDLLTQHAEEVQAVITDIEMPRLNGIGLTQRIRGDVRFAKLPVIAVSSLAGEEDIANGKAAGIDEYQVKLDRDQLLSSVHAAMARATMASV